MQRPPFSLKDNLLNGGFIAIHLGVLLVFVVGFSWVALAAAVLFYVLRMFFITAFYHRYFAHRTYKTSRPFQFLMGFAGASCLQNGPIWWSAHHRHHHKHSDTDKDVHSPIARSFFWAHMGWILSKEFNTYDPNSVKDLTRYPELRWLQRWNIVPAVVMGVMIFAGGEVLASVAPELGTNGLQMLTWGFFVSTTVLYHATFTINSLMHKIGRRRFETEDHSKNSLILALITFGEGWHNNHHRYHASERQGFYWWEIDISHYGLVFLSWLGLVWDLKKPPKRIYEEAAGVRARRLTPARAKDREARRKSDIPVAPNTSRKSTPAPKGVEE